MIKVGVIGALDTLLGLLGQSGCGALEEGGAAGEQDAGAQSSSEVQVTCLDRQSHTARQPGVPIT